MKKITIIALSTTMLTSCTTLQRLTEVNEAPRMSEINNPLANPDYVPVTGPMPQTYSANYSGENSLWKTGARGFFKDQRAQKVGDILTIKVNINDNATLANDTDRNRENSESLSATNILNYQQYFQKLLPHGAQGKRVDPSNLIGGYASNPKHKGHGKTARTDALNTLIAATVNQMLPNGNFVVSGRQEMRVNNELREVLITGIIRPEDITADNTITYEKIAEARISYGGRGQLSDMQQPPWGQQILNTLSPL